MGQLTAQLVLLGVLVIAFLVGTTMTSVLTNRKRSSRTAVYLFALKSRSGDNKEAGEREEHETPEERQEDTRRDKDQDMVFVDKFFRPTRNEPSAVVKHEDAFSCRDIVPWALALIQTSVDRDFEDTYYHVPRGAFYKRSKPPFSLPTGLQIENVLNPSVTADQDPRCYPQCPVRLRLLPPERDRLWPKNLVVAECACKESHCAGRGRYQCRQMTTPVLIIRGEPGQPARYCPELVPAGCRCIPVRTVHAATFRPFAITVGKDDSLSDHS